MCVFGQVYLSERNTTVPERHSVIVSTCRKSLPCLHHNANLPNRTVSFSRRVAFHPASPRPPVFVFEGGFPFSGTFNCRHHVRRPWWATPLKAPVDLRLKLPIMPQVFHIPYQSAIRRQSTCRHKDKWGKVLTGSVYTPIVRLYFPICLVDSSVLGGNLPVCSPFRKGIAFNLFWISVLFVCLLNTNCWVKNVNFYCVIVQAVN